MTGFHDGLVMIYRAEDQAAPGDKPVERLVWKAALRFQRRTVGVRRHYAALSAGARVDLLLRVPYRPEVSALDVAVPTLDEKQYRIALVQVPEGVTPPVMDLTLQRLERVYEMPEQDTGRPACGDQ